MSSDHRVSHYKRIIEKSTTHSYSGHKKSVRTVAWNHTGEKFATGAEDGQLLVYPLPSRKRSVREVALSGHTDAINHVAWDPKDEMKLAAVSSDMTLRLFDVRAGKQTSGIHCKASTISVAFAPDGNTIAVLTKGSNQQIYLFDIRNELKMLRKVIYPADMHEILWSPDGSLFMMALSVPTPGGAIAVLNAQTMDTETSVRLPGHTGACWSIAMDPMRKYFASGGSDSFVNIWDMQELHCARSISASEERIMSLGFSYDGKLIASGAEKEHHVETGTKLFELRASVYATAWSPKRYLLAYVGDDRLDRNRSDAVVNVLEFDEKANDIRSGMQNK